MTEQREPWLGAAPPASDDQIQSAPAASGAPPRLALQGSRSRTSWSSCRRAAALPLAGVHIFRHSAAKLRRDAGESIENVSRFLDHSSLQVTSIYLRRLEGEADARWEKVAAAIGIA